MRTLEKTAAGLLFLLLLSCTLSGNNIDPNVRVEFRVADAAPFDGGVAMVDLKGETVWVGPTAAVETADLSYVDVHLDDFGQHGVIFFFNDEGARKMEALSEAQLTKKVALLIDGELITAPTVQGMIGETMAMTGGWSHDEARLIVERVEIDAE